MSPYKNIIIVSILSCLLLFPHGASAASITETNAAIGEGCVASGDNSTAMGYGTTASGKASTAMGIATTASGFYSTAMGRSTEASEMDSTAMGYDTTASGYAATAMGFGSRAIGSYSTATGRNNTTRGEVSWVGGRYMYLVDTAHHTFVWGYSDSPQTVSAANAFLIFPAGTAGKVGIGTNNPQNLVDLGATQGKKLAVFQKTTGDDFYGFGISSATLEIYAGVTSGDTNPAVVVKKTSGNVGIGTSSPSYLLEVDGSAGKPGGSTWSNSSDERLKDVIGEYIPGLREIVLLKPVAFYYKEDNFRGLPSDEKYVGFIAQEVQEVFPEAVSEGPDGYLDFNMHSVNVAVVNAIKELKAENDAIRIENEFFRAENAMLKEDIKKIKRILGI